MCSPLSLDHLRQSCRWGPQQDNNLAILLTPPAGCLEAGLLERGKQTRVFSFSFCGIIARLLFREIFTRNSRRGAEDQDKVDLRCIWGRHYVRETNHRIYRSLSLEVKCSVSPKTRSRFWQVRQEDSRTHKKANERRT